MKYLKERKLAQEGCIKHLGFAPSLESIIPLESTTIRGVCEFVLFTVKGSKHTYSYDTYTLQINVLGNLDEHERSITLQGLYMVNA